MQILCAVLVGIMIAASIYLILDRNLIRFIFGLVLASNAINLLILTAGRLASRRPPLIPDKMTMGQELFANALPQALILTAIVIGVGILALALGLAVRTYALFGTLDTRELAERIAREGETYPPPETTRGQTVPVPDLAEDRP